MMWPCSRTAALILPPRRAFCAHSKFFWSVFQLFRARFDISQGRSGQCVVDLGNEDKSTSRRRPLFSTGVVHTEVDSGLRASIWKVGGCTGAECWAARVQRHVLYVGYVICTVCFQPCHKLPVEKSQSPALRTTSKEAEGLVMIPPASDGGVPTSHQMTPRANRFTAIQPPPA